MQTLEEHFWSLVNKNGPTPDPVKYPGFGQCWLWTGFIRWQDGYGILVHNGYFRAHCLSYVLQFGPIPEGKEIMHLCDNPTCVRHIAAGTHVENMAGAVLRGRVRRGEDKPTAVFTNEEVSKMLQLYSEGVRVRDLAIAFSGKRGTIHNIVHQNSWKFLSRDYKIEKRHKGSGHYKARVTEDDVRKIRHLKSSGYTLKQLGKQFGLTIPALSLIVNRKNWTHVE